MEGRCSIKKYNITVIKPKYESLTNLPMQNCESSQFKGAQALSHTVKMNCDSDT